jgi:hypothetical protein
MSVIVISKGSYSHGNEVATKVAKRLDLNCVSRDILIDTFKKFNISELRLICAIENLPLLFWRSTLKAFQPTSESENRSRN